MTNPLCRPNTQILMDLPCKWLQIFHRCYKHSKKHQKSLLKTVRFHPSLPVSKQQDGDSENTQLQASKKGPPTCDVIVAISIFYTIYVKGWEKDEWRLFETVDHTKLLVENNRSLPRIKSGAKPSYVPLWSKSWWRIICGLQTHGRNVKTWKWRENCQRRPQKPFINQESHF